MTRSDDEALHHGHVEEFDLVRASTPGRSADFSSLDFDHALRFLKDSARDVRSMTRLREALARDCGADVRRMSDEDVRRQVAWRLASGRFHVRTPSMRATGGFRTRQAAPEGEKREAEAFELRPAARATRTPPPVVHWIEFEVLDDESGEPVPNVVLQLALPDGSTSEHTTDANGVIRLADLSEGSCEIVAMREENAAEVVDISGR